MGAAGAIAATGCFAAAETAQIGTAFAGGDRARAGALQERVAPLHREIVAGLGVAGVKAAVETVGLPGGPVRPPLTDLGDRDRARVARLLREAGVSVN
jgi:dihydrodipicolinate synthase/N-acetylneuraminate lyase